MFSAFWALQIFVAKLGFSVGALVLPFQLWMVLFAVATLAIVLFPSSGAELVRLYNEHPKTFWNLFLANIIQAGLGTSLSIIGIAMTDAINAGFLVKLATVSTILFAWIILQEKMTGYKIAVVLVMISGAYLLTTKGQSLLPRVGDIFILGACVCWSLGNIMVRKVLKARRVRADVVTIQKPVTSLLFFLALVGISFLLPSLPGNFSDVFICCNFRPEFLPYALGSGISLALAWIYLYRTLHIATASYMTLMSMATPLLVSILAMTFLDERLIFVQIIGAGMIILAGVVIYLSDIAYA